jgi:hypothetical protein
MGQDSEDSVVFETPTTLSKRWRCSVDKAAKIVEPYRGRVGFVDLGRL